VSDHILPPHWPFIPSRAVTLQGCPRQVSPFLDTPSPAAHIGWTLWPCGPPLAVLMPDGMGWGHLSWVYLEEQLHVVLGPQHGQALGGWGGSVLPLRLTTK